MKRTSLMALAVAAGSLWAGTQGYAGENQYRPVGLRTAAPATVTKAVDTKSADLPSGKSAETKTAFWGCYSPCYQTYRPIVYPSYPVYQGCGNYGGCGVGIGIGVGVGVGVGGYGGIGGYPAPYYSQPVVNPGYGVPGYGAPGYGAPGYGAPGYGYGAPGYGVPAYGNPGYGAPGFGGPYGPYGNNPGTIQTAAPVGGATPAYNSSAFGNTNFNIPVSTQASPYFP